MVLIDFFLLFYYSKTSSLGQMTAFFSSRKYCHGKVHWKYCCWFFFTHFSCHCKHAHFLCCAQCTIFLLAGSCSQTCGNEGKTTSSNQFFINVRAKRMHTDRSHSLAYACMRECVHTRTHTHMRQKTLAHAGEGAFEMTSSPELVACKSFLRCVTWKCAWAWQEKQI